MEYTVQKLGQLAGISARTLRYYDEIGLLKPARVNSSGYRIYCQKEVGRLQQIMFYKELGVSLEVIKEIITSPSYDEAKALIEHHEKLLDKRKQLDVLIANVEKTIASMGGRISMTDKEKFEGFKQQLIDENENKYGTEIRTKYGDDALEQSSKKLMNMTKEEYGEVICLANDIFTTLAAAFADGDPASSKAQKTAELHKKWLMYYWSDHSKEAHASLAQMYVDDERFKAYYEKQPGMTEFLRDAIHVFTLNAEREW